MSTNTERPVDGIGAACRFVVALVDRLGDVDDDEQADRLYGIVAPLPDGRSVAIGDLTAADVAAVRRRVAGRAQLRRFRDSTSPLPLRN